MAEIIVEEILWTDNAKLSFNKIVQYLKEYWTEKEIEKFVQRTSEVLSTLQCYPEMCRPSIKRRNVRIALLVNLPKRFTTINPKKIEMKYYCFGV